MTDDGGSAALSPAPCLETRNAFREHVLDSRFPCVGAKSAIRTGHYRVGLYSLLGGAETTVELAADLVSFMAEQDTWEDAYSSFIACFRGPYCTTEACFEDLLWHQLQQLHDLDDRDWDPAVSMDPNDPGFSFSFAGRAFFVVGLHRAASRLARRFAWPALVFNAHRQFDGLRSSGHFTRMRDMIRQRDRALQGAPNPMVGDYGQTSEARQYSGRAVDRVWRCPFHAYPKKE